MWGAKMLSPTHLSIPFLLLSTPPTFLTLTVKLAYELQRTPLLVVTLSEV